MFGIFIQKVKDEKVDLEPLNTATREWTLKAARGECAWTCADCSVTFDKGMPDACEHGHESCTAIIQRDKQMAKDGKWVEP